MFIIRLFSKLIFAPMTKLQQRERKKALKKLLKIENVVEIVASEATDARHSEKRLKLHQK